MTENTDEENQYPSFSDDSQTLSYFSLPSSSYFDDLSQNHITKSTLWELNRRNTQGLLRSQRPRIPRYCTRLVIAKWKKEHPSVEQLLQNYSPSDLERLRQYSTHGGPDLRDLIGFYEPSPLDYMMTANPDPDRRRKTATKRTKLVSPSDLAFQQHLNGFGAFPVDCELPGGRVPPEPENLNEIREALARPRASLARVSVKDFQQFRRDDFGALMEHQVVTSVLPAIEGDVAGGLKCGGAPFENLYPLTNGSLSVAKPDQYYGSLTGKIENRILEDIGAFIMPAKQHSLPAAPNFFLEIKGPDGKPVVALRQAWYDALLGARGIHNLRSYGLTSSSPSTYDNKAYTMTATYSAGMLKLFTIHPIYSDTAHRPEFILTQIAAVAMTNDLDEFRKGAAMYRNAVEWAKEQREDIINKANERVRGSSTATTVSSQPSAMDQSYEEYHDPYMITSLKVTSSSKRKRDTVSQSRSAQRPPKRRG